MLQHHTMKEYEELQVQLQPVLTSALDGVEWSTSWHSYFVLGAQSSSTHWAGCWLSPTAVLNTLHKRLLFLLQIDKQFFDHPQRHPSYSCYITMLKHMHDFKIACSSRILRQLAFTSDQLTTNLWLTGSILFKLNLSIIYISCYANVTRVLCMMLGCHMITDDTLGFKKWHIQLWVLLLVTET